MGDVLDFTLVAGFALLCIVALEPSLALSCALGLFRIRYALQERQQRELSLHELPSSMSSDDLAIGQLSD